MKIVAKALIKDKGGRILVLFRSDSHPLYAGHPDFPGGEVEMNETGMDGVIREIYEETGIRILHENLKLVIQNYNNDHTSYEAYSAFLQDDSPIITLSWEHTEYTWLTRQELLAMPLPAGVDDYYQMVIDNL